MNKQLSLLSAAVVAMSLSASAGAVTVAQWTFETSVPVTAGPFAAEVGSGTALGSHTSGSAVYSNPVGNGSGESFSSNYWSVDDYYQFQTSTTGYADVMLSWDQTSSSTGPKDFKLSYSTDGTVFTDFASYAVLGNGTSPNLSWSSSTPQPVYNFAYDLSGVTALDNQAKVYFRLTNTSTTAINGSAVATSGTDRVDNFMIAAAPVPEADTWAMLLAGLGLVGFMARRRKA
jgi:MYXO-CTERM domain-containing protein